MRGADRVAQTLAAGGVGTVFTLSGNQIMPIFDACIDAGIELIHVRHEAAAVYMADAWAQLSGEVGVALLTAGPGFVNGLSPLYSALAAESPVLLLSGDAPLAQQGMGAFQELDQAAVSTPMTKSAVRLDNAATLGSKVAAAIRLARSGRPGPVHLAIPFDLLDQDVETCESIAPHLFDPDRIPLSTDALRNILTTLERAERPIVLTGPGFNPSRAGDFPHRLAEHLDLPIIALESPRGLGDPALGGCVALLAEADAVLSLGKKIDFSMGYGRSPPFDPRCRFTVVQPDPESLQQAKRVLGNRLESKWLADTWCAVESLLDSRRPAPRRHLWRERIKQALAARTPPERASSSTRVLPNVLCHAVQQVLDHATDPVLIVDGGEFGQWAQACLSASTRVINGPAGAIGGGLCYAVAAKINRPNATVITLMGDGTVGFHLSEFETALRCNAAFIAVVGNDARWNAEFQIQLRDYGPDRLIGCELAPTRYDLAAAGLGCHGEYVTDENALPGALQRAIASGRPACINVEIEGRPAPVEV